MARPATLRTSKAPSASTPAFPAASRPFFDLFGPTDMSLFGDLAADSMPGLLFGGRLKDKSDLVKLANPIAFVTKDDPPVLIIHGDKDTLVPISQSEVFETSLKKADVPVTLVRIAGAGHGGLQFVTSDVLNQVEGFFARISRRRTPDPMSFRSVAFIRLTQGSQKVERFVDGADDRARHSAARVEVPEEHQILEMLRRFQDAPHSPAEFAGLVLERVHVMLDQEPGALGDEFVENRKTGLDVVARVNALADIMQEGGRQEFLVVRPAFASQLEHLERVIEHVTFGMMLCGLANVFRAARGADERPRVDRRRRFGSLQVVEIDVGIFFGEQFLQLADRSPLDRFAGDRASEDVMSLVLCVDGEFEVKPVEHMNVREDAGLIMLDDLLAFDVKLKPLAFERSRMRAGLSVKTWTSISEPLRTWPVITLPMSRVYTPAGAASCGERPGACLSSSRCGARLRADEQRAESDREFRNWRQIGRLDAAPAESPSGLTFCGGKYSDSPVRTSGERLHERWLDEVFHETFLSCAEIAWPHSCGARLDRSDPVGDL